MRTHRSHVLVAIALTSLAAPAGAQLPVNDEPLTAKWAPSEWGPDDKVGAPNRTTPELVLKAVRPRQERQERHARQGLRVGRAGLRYAQLEAASFRDEPTGGPFGDQQLVYNDEYVATELGQIGTQFDGPGHIGVITSKGMFYYNGRFLHDKDDQLDRTWVRSESSTSRRRASCAAACCSMRWRCAAATLPVPKENSASDPGIVTAKDVQAMVERQGLAPIGVGDCVFLYTGHGDIWHPKDWDTYDAAEKAKRVAQFNAGEPGFGISACEYLAERKVILTGADTWAHRGRRQGLRRRDPATLRVSHEAADQARHLEPGEPGLFAAGRRQGLRVPVRVVAAQDEGRDGLAGQPDGAVLGARSVHIRGVAATSGQQAAKIDEAYDR